MVPTCCHLERADVSTKHFEHSDIFGIIISNAVQKDVSKWNWEMGEELDGTGIPLRDFRDPTRRGQPAHMKDYVHRPNTYEGDWGGVHVNCGIHNEAAYNLLTAKGPDGKYLFDPRTVAALFFIALTQHLSRTSGFLDSRRGVELAARSLLRRDPMKNRRIDALGKAFDDVGIVAGEAGARILS
jgi:Zn-dependent metalloprotease